MWCGFPFPKVKDFHLNCIVVGQSSNVALEKQPLLTNQFCPPPTSNLGWNFSHFTKQKVLVTNRLWDFSQWDPLLPVIKCWRRFSAIPVLCIIIQWPAFQNISITLQEHMYINAKSCSLVWGFVLYVAPSWEVIILISAVYLNAWYVPVTLLRFYIHV